MPGFDTSEYPVGQLGGYQFTAKRQYGDNEPYVLVDVVGVPVDGIAVSVGGTENPAPVWSSASRARSAAATDLGC